MAPRFYSAAATKRMVELEGTPLASFSRRAFAFSFDFLVVSLVFAMLSSIAALVHLLPSPESTRIEFEFTNWYSMAIVIIYHALLNRYWNGQTLGKHLAKIQVVSTTHSHLTLWHAIERALGYGASTLELGFGFLQYFFTENRQTMHDRIGSTVVISTQRAKSIGSDSAAD